MYIISAVSYRVYRVIIIWLTVSAGYETVPGTDTSSGEVEDHGKLH